jgi:hypothetical protein
VAAGLEFVLLFLVPDVSMIGYVANARVGFVIYNPVHTYVGPLALGGYSVWRDQRQALLLSPIWAAHIGLVVSKPWAALSKVFSE